MKDPSDLVELRRLVWREASPVALGCGTETAAGLSAERFSTELFRGQTVYRVPSLWGGFTPRIRGNHMSNTTHCLSNADAIQKRGK